MLKLGLVKNLKKQFFALKKTPRLLCMWWKFENEIFFKKALSGLYFLRQKLYFSTQSQTCSNDVVVQMMVLKVVQQWSALHWRIENVVSHHTHVGLYEEQIQEKRNNSPLFKCNLKDALVIVKNTFFIFILFKKIEGHA